MSYLSRRVAVALSGGVDSAVVAALMKEQGYDVVALTMLLQKTDHPADSIAIAQALGIEHHIIDLTSSFAQQVVEPFANSYAAGETPVPCVLCNRLIKFGALMDVARTYGADQLATGHYAKRIEVAGFAQLHRGDDSLKDQSYFLFSLSQGQIDFLRLPLGDKSKEQTRGLAQKYALPVAQKKDSQDICFVPCGDYVSVMEKLKPEALLPGSIVDLSGNVLGQHQGVARFTVGQRKGLNLSDRTGDHNDPLFVVRLVPAERKVIVGPREALMKSAVLLRDMNWLGGSSTVQDMPVAVRLRSAQPPQQALLTLKDGWGYLSLSVPVSGVAPGQAGVIYEGSRVMGGGWICSTDFPKS